MLVFFSQNMLFKLVNSVSMCYHFPIDCAILNIANDTMNYPKWSIYRASIVGIPIQSSWRIQHLPIGCRDYIWSISTHQTSQVGTVQESPLFTIPGTETSLPQTNHGKLLLCFLVFVSLRPYSQTTNSYQQFILAGSVFMTFEHMFLFSNDTSYHHSTCIF